MRGPFINVHLFGMGFRQTPEYRTGLELLWLDFRRLAAPDTLIHPPIEWDADPDAIAGLLSRVCLPQCRIRGVFYSWGGGWLFPRLAHAMQAHDLAFESVVMIDAVYRSPLLPAWLPANPLSLISGPTITVPANVKRVVWFRQRNDRPAGHRLIAESAATVIEPCVWLDRVHTTMDEAPEAHAAAWRLAHSEIR